MSISDLERGLRDELDIVGRRVGAVPDLDARVIARHRQRVRRRRVAVASVMVCALVAAGATVVAARHDASNSIAVVRDPDAVPTTVTTDAPAANAPSATNHVVQELQVLGGPVPASAYSAPVVADPRSASAAYYNAWETPDGSPATLDIAHLLSASGVPTIRHRVLGSGVDELAVRHAFAPVPSHDGSLAYARPTAATVSGGTFAPSDVVVRAPDGTERVVYRGDGHMAYPLRWAGSTLLIQWRATGPENGTLLQDAVLVNAAGNVASNLGTPLAVSTDGRYALFTVAQVSSGNVLHVVDATTLRDVSAISRAAYANAFLLPKDRANFIPIPAPGEEGYGWPVAPQGFGTWTTDVVVLGATGAVITFGVDGGVLHPGVTIPIDPLAVAGATTVNVVGTWPGASGRSVNLAVRMPRTGVAILTCTVDSCSPADPSITEPPLPNVS